MTRVSAVGSVGTVRERLAAILAATRADELILTAHIYDHAARLRSFELASHAMREVGQRGGARRCSRTIGGSPPSAEGGSRKSVRYNNRCALRHRSVNDGPPTERLAVPVTASTGGIVRSVF